MKTIKLTSVEHLAEILDRAMTIKKVSEKDGLRIVSRSRIPFFENHLHFTADNLKQFWPDAVRVLSSMEKMYGHVVKEQGVALLKSAFHQTSINPGNDYMMLGEGFLLKNDISAIIYRWPHEKIIFKTFTDRTVQSTAQAVSRNYGEIINLLNKFYDMDLTSVENANVVKSGVNFTNITKQNLPAIRPEVRAPDSIADILAISSLRENLYSVHYIARESVSGKIKHYCYPTDDFDVLFPHSKQALLAVASSRCQNDVERAAFMRHWWRDPIVTTATPLWFLLEDEKRMGYPKIAWYFLDGDESNAPYSNPFLPPAHWSNLHSIEESEFYIKKKWLLFRTQENKIVHSSVDDLQSAYLGLDTILTLVESLGLERHAAAGPVIQALTSTRAPGGKNMLPDIEFDPSSGL